MIKFPDFEPGTVVRFKASSKAFLVLRTERAFPGGMWLIAYLMDPKSDPKGLNASAEIRVDTRLLEEVPYNERVQQCLQAIADHLYRGEPKASACNALANLSIELGVPEPYGSVTYDYNKPQEQGCIDDLREKVSEAYNFVELTPLAEAIGLRAELRKDIAHVMLTQRAKGIQSVEYSTAMERLERGQSPRHEQEASR
ncbi:MAG: hypothetical protein AAFQ53_11310 [Bacteroidota bacterium]